MIYKMSGIDRISGKTVTNQPASATLSVINGQVG